MYKKKGYIHYMRRCRFLLLFSYQPSKCFALRRILLLLLLFLRESSGGSQRDPSMLSKEKKNLFFFFGPTLSLSAAVAVAMTPSEQYGKPQGTKKTQKDGDLELRSTEATTTTTTTQPQTFVNCMQKQQQQKKRQTLPLF